MLELDKELDEKQQIAKAIAGKAHYLTSLTVRGAVPKLCTAGLQSLFHLKNILPGFPGFFHKISACEQGLPCRGVPDFKGGCGVFIKLEKRFFLS